MSTFDDVEFLVQWIRDRITLPGYQPKAWSSMDLTTVKEFVESTNIPALFITLLNGTLSVTTSAPRGVNGTVMYFVKNGQVIISPSNVADALQFGTVGKDSIASLLHLMNGHFLQRLQANKAWPESIQKEFTGQFFRFMSSLTETVSRGCGKTVLYLPPVSPDKFNYKDKDLVQQLESTVIHWTRQIKEVINNQDNAHDAEGAGPLEEIKFWEHRTQDLSGITDQLNRQGVKEIVEILRQAKSSYLQPFETLSQIIKQGSVEANDNLKFLKKLSPVCEDIARAQPDEISLMLPKLLNFIRLIWTYSKHYNTEDRITSLLRKVSNEIIVVCCKKISLHDIFDGNVEASICHLEQSIQCELAHIVSSAESDETQAASDSLRLVINEYIQRKYHDWIEDLNALGSMNLNSRILLELSSTERRLFEDIIRKLDRPEKKDGEEVDSTDDVNKSVAAATSTAVAVNNFYQSIFNDEEILKVLVHIMNGMSSSATELQKYLGYWDKYKLLWNQDKQAFIRRYAKANRPLQQFRADIERYREQQTSIQNEDLTNTINFIQIDTNFLKASLVEHTVQWIGKLTGLLNQTANDELRELMTMMKDNTKRLQVKPTNLDHLGESIRLLQDIKEGIPGVIARFEPLQQKYDLLSEFDVQVTDEEQRDLANLKTNWDTYEVMLGEANTMLQKCKISMKQNLQDSVAELNTIMSDLRAEAEATLPYSGDQVSGVAHKILADFEKKMESTRARQSALKKGLEIFGIEESKNEGFLQTEKEIELLQQIWVLTDEWESVWATWKNKVFYEIEVDSMEATAAQFFKKVVKYGKEMKNWTVWSSMKTKIEQFRQTLPLIQDLKSPALRPRHWAQLKEEMGKSFDPESEAFTLERVFSLGFHLHAEFISTLSGNASKELSIEQALDGIEKRWAEIEIDIGEYKGVYYKIKSADDLFTALEDDQVQLSTMKASPFFGSFDTKILYWERALSLMSEVIETLLTVQRSWIYLESIFMASEDIRKQLPLESTLFDEVNSAYCRVTEGMAKTRNALKATQEEGVLPTLQQMEEKLDRIQKCLDQYLETKRMLFPRFYFLSNDDLLEILGHQKDPDQVQKHIKKCFEAIKTLVLIAPGTREGWLLKVESAMVNTLEKIFAQCLVGYKGKKEKWIKDFPGQLLITCGQTAWTNECIKALNEVAKGEKKALKQLKKKWISYLNKLADMVRDLALIAEVMLQAEGFRDAKTLAKKTTTLYGLMIQQLSKQDHYDFGLRSLKAVLNMAGALKREDPNLQEENILLRALRDMNMPKFIREDAALFRLLLGDLFPGIELPVTDYGKLQGTIEQELAEQKLQVHGQIVFKTIQLYESQVTRHCNMIVGQTMAGKSTIWKTLQAAKTTLAKDGIQGYMPVRVQVLNPKSISLNEIYGVYDLTTFEWIDGILSAIFRNLAADERAEEKWIMLDGPVDTLWIESMNSVMDDNKVLTLINGDRISMSPSMSLLFEVQDLAVASPATNALSGEGNKFAQFVEKWFLFCMTWSVMGAANEDGRKKFDMCLRDIDTVYPPLKTAYDFYVDAQAHEFKLWDEKLPQSLYQNVMEQFLPTPANSHYLFNLRDMAKVVQGLLLGDKNGQANKWIKSMEGSRLEVVDPMMKDLLRKLENGIRFGFPVLMQDVLEELDPSLEPVLNKSIIKIGNREVIRLGDKELDYNRDFKFYLTTKLHNPHYTPEVSTKTTIVNFVVKEQGLEAQLLGITVQLEEPALEEQKSDLVVRVAAAKKKLIDLENEILRLLSAAKGSLLDDESLVTTLNASKTTSEEVTQQLIISEETEKKIDAARMGYARVALRSSTLYFVLNDMTSVDPMYQFSLDSYVSLFKDSIVKSRNMKNQAALSEELTERINAINDYHTYAVYAYACRGLFERHKLLFSLQMCVRVLQSVNKLPQDEYEFLLKGGNSMGSEERVTNVASEFLSETAWLSIVELNKLQRFHGLISSFEQSTKAWKSWYQSSTPEIEPLPGDWDGKCNELQRMLLLRCIRPDRLSIQAARFTTSNLGAQFVDPPPFDLKAIYETSNYKTPLIFVLSPGVDPTNSLMALADSLHKKVENCALGQGQATVAEAMLQRGLEGGNWVFLANCHLMLSWAPTLEKLIDSYCSATAQVNPGFRLWLTSDPNPKFPIAILQRGIKMTTEPPRGLKANLLRLYNTITPEKFARCRQVKKYKRLLFCLCWFHSLLLERRKFNNLGWNIPYDFNESDFAISEDVLAIYLDEYEETPWDALKYLIAQANYGGRVTDDWDRRLMLVYINQFFSEEVLQVDNMPLSDSEYYFVPDDGDLHAYAEYIKQLPLDDPPAAFGQHPNAQIASQIDDGRELLSTILSLQAMGVAEGGKGNDEKVLTLLQSLKDSVPEVFDLANIKLGLSARSDPDALKTVLMQELERYNKLLSAIRGQLVMLEKGMQGAVVITPELEAVYNAMLIGQPFPMELHSSMPILHFKPVESKKKSSKGLYSCPLYLYPLRTGTRERPSFMIAVDLKSGSGKSPDLWTKRGTALLLSLST
ncbi:hypothetical protein P43SY_005034 [Pythium insidiosum]|uniref:Dynein heavy chain n=1 Tax=Pythium insidiosum TaxID=114742 RepID=A0AAD5M1X5_PYTIN|nr:hypothetical protein P43SY_005034 [Pythium insidiosum]